MLQHYAKRGSKLNRPLRGLAHSVFLTSRDGARFLYHSRTMVLRRADGLPPKVRPSTCKTSSVARSYARRSWLRKGISLLWEIYRRSSPVFSRGLQTMRSCYASSSQVATRMHSSALRCSTSRVLQKSRTPTFGSRLNQLSWGPVMAWVGRRLQHSCLSAFLVRRLYGTSASSRRPWGSRRKMLRSSWTTRSTSRR